MSGFQNLGAVLLVAIAVLAIIAWRTKREGESFEHAYERLLNTDAHKEREANRRAGLSTPKPAAPPGGETAGKEDGGDVGSRG